MYYSVVLLLTGCSLFSVKESAEFMLPSWPPENADEGEFPELSFWDVRITGADGCSAVRVDKGCGSITEYMEKNIPCSITARPVTVCNGGEASFFYPAGCIYPYSCEVTWRNGFASDVMEKLYRASLSDEKRTAEYLAYFNWQRLVSEIDGKTAASRTSGNIFYNPYHANVSAVISEIASRSFSITSLAVLNDFTVDVSASMLCGTDINALIPAYIPSYQALKDSGKLTLSSLQLNSFYYKEDRIMYISGTSESSCSLAITPVPLYTGK